MSYKPGDLYVGEFTTENPTTHIGQDADSLPTAIPNHDGTDDPGAFPLTVVKIDTGRYKVVGTIPLGYAPGASVNVTVQATVAGVTSKAKIEKFVIDGLRVSDLASQGVALSATGLDNVQIEVGINARQALQIIGAAAAGVLAGATTTTTTFAAMGHPGTPRISATTPGDGNRTGVSVSPDP